MVATYQLGLLIEGRLAVVVGGGSVAARVVADLLAAEAQVLVVAPTLGHRLAKLAERGLITARRRDYAPTDLDTAWLVIACTEQEAVNARVAADAEERRIWCARTDDTAGVTALLAGPLRAAGPRVLVLGGARSGKSATAESMLADCGPVDYVATGRRIGSSDGEWDERLRGHQERRPRHWRTVETIDLDVELTHSGKGAPMLIDCLATWLAQVMDSIGVWADDPDADRGDADKQLAIRVDRLVAAWQATRRHVVAVSNEVGSGIVPATVAGRRFRDELGWLNARIAAASDEVWLCTAGIPARLK